ncbi:MAG: hypothetical protein K6T83_14720 [Alicyclobacillus sp.]|nr:hypothetical protein [Alicyclobacillus sp.]
MSRKLLWGIGGLIIGTVIAGSALVDDKPAKATTSATVHGSKESAFHPPTEVLGVTIAGDSPASMWYYPSDVARVTLQVYNWLSHSTPVTVQMPKSNVGVVMDYAGPAQLSFTDGNGHHIMVYPAYYLADAHQNAYGGPIVKRYPFPGVVAYQDGSTTAYLKSPALYNWLKQDAWKSEFVSESYTPAEQRAIQAVSDSKWHWLFRRLFPSRPCPAVRDIPRGGMTDVHGHTVTLPGTCATYVGPDGDNIRVSLTETWYNGKAQHTWTFVVSPQGKILSNTQSGDVAPQSWK